MREAEYKDHEGRRFMVWLPEGVPDSEAEKGVRIGPPSLEPLQLPLSLEVKLNNELYHRRIFTEATAKARRQDILGALMAALGTDAGRIVDLYALTGVGQGP